MKIVYEWDRETVDPDSGDILEHHHRPNLAPLVGEPGALVLIRDVLNGGGYTEHRSWAYVLENNRLPDHFSDAHGRVCASVPPRFHKELSEQFPSET